MAGRARDEDLSRKERAHARANVEVSLAGRSHTGGGGRRGVSRFGSAHWVWFSPKELTESLCHTHTLSLYQLSAADTARDFGVSLVLLDWRGGHGSTPTFTSFSLLNLSMLSSLPEEDDKQLPMLSLRG